MPDVTATGYIGTQIEAIRYAFAYSSAFRTLTGTSTIAGAYAYTFANWHVGIPTKPFVVVMRGNLQREKYGTNAWMQQASILVRFEYVLDYDPYSNPQKALTDLENAIASVMANVEAINNTKITVGTGVYATIPDIATWRIVEEGARFSTPGDSYFAVGQTIELELSPVYG